MPWYIRVHKVTGAVDSMQWSSVEQKFSDTEEGQEVIEVPQGVALRALSSFQHNYTFDPVAKVLVETLDVKRSLDVQNPDVDEI